MLRVDVNAMVTSTIRLRIDRHSTAIRFQLEFVSIFRLHKGGALANDVTSFCDVAMTKLHL